MTTFPKPPSQKAQRAERARLIRELGWAPEPEKGPASERYAATTGELAKWVAEKATPAAPVAPAPLQLDWSEAIGVDVDGKVWR